MSLAGNNLGKGPVTVYTGKEEMQTSRLSAPVVVSLISRKKGPWEECFGALPPWRKPA